ncbi:MAG: hypothetical protein KME45_22460 [Stenomitos rutilans HA7619-LM2]|nr:hypothetical protein [Stenomitos rutilans HA7619-LM2]
MNLKPMHIRTIAQTPRSLRYYHLKQRIKTIRSANVAAIEKTKHAIAENTKTAKRGLCGLSTSAVEQQ